MQKNGFLAHFGYPSMHDTNDTAIQYLKLKPSDGRFFNQYVMTESIYEIFVNAQIHSESKHIYTSGGSSPPRRLFNGRRRRAIRQS